MNRLLLILLVALASGCASYQKPIAMPEAQIGSEKLAQAAMVTSTVESSSKAFAKVALANGGECSKKGPRLPFTLFVNPQLKDLELRAAFIHAGGWTEQPKFVSLHESTLHLNGKYVVALDGESIGLGEVHVVLNQYFFVEENRSQKPFIEIPPETWDVVVVIRIILERDSSKAEVLGCFVSIDRDKVGFLGNSLAVKFDYRKSRPVWQIC